MRCRNSASWRAIQAAPEACPYGLPIGHSADGVRRGDYAEGPVTIFRGPAPCRWLAVMPTGGCCDNDFYCTREGCRQIKPGACRDCEQLTTDN